MKQLILMITAALLSACNMAAEEDAEIFPVKEQVNEVAAEYAYAFENASPLQLFFKEDQTKAIFSEERSDGTSFTEETFWLSENYVKTIVKKQGEVTYKIYRITRESIELIYEAQTQPQATVAELNQMAAKKIFLTLPLEIGTTLEDWTVTNVAHQLETPFETFYDVIELTQEADGQIIRQYFASGFGLIKETISIPSGKGINETSYLLNALEY